ncbi:sensor histidine kinase [Deinococcus aquaedulcis]|uniref:sensor histidine kinase n=1 Tax=Deinococcus aquaedulcis TaxID=2840455 RepID=UPI001C83EAEF|nr:ATP-binding protein [Deinococcus aquaedulcis]
MDSTESRTFALFLRRLTTEPGRRSLDLWLRGADERRLAVQMEGEAVPGAPGVPSHCRLTLTDITLQREAQEEVMRLNASLEAQVEERTRHIRELSDELETFLYAAAHDLTTPLRHIRTFTSQLSAGPPGPSPEQVRCAEQVEQAAEHMEHQLRALLTIFRIGRSRMRFQAVDLNRVLHEVRKDLAADLRGREVVLSADGLPRVPGDSLALQLVFSHLVGNALKFSRTRCPARIQVGAQEADREWLLYVRDNGVGFNMRQKDRLFGVFQRLHRDSDYEGMGVGLALVRRIVNRHGGRVWAEGKVDQGATFWFSVPKVPPTGAPDGR